MATERSWTLISSSIDNVEYDTVSALENTYTYSSQKVASLLYNMKDALVNQMGWTVVSCSYRSDSNVSHVNSTTQFTVDTTDQWTTGSNGFATGSIACGDVTNSGGYYNVTSSASVGRSWILLKHSGSYTPTMQENSGDFYHILLDYSGIDANPNATSAIVDSSAEREGSFGKGINIVVFPKAPSNPLGSPSATLRPHDPAEILYYPVSANSTFQLTDPTTSANDKLYVLYEQNTKGFIFLITGGGEFRAFFAMNTYSDHFATQDGKVFTMAYSQIGNSKVKLNSSTAVSYLITRGNTASMALTATACIRGVKRYQSGTYTVSPFITTIPAVIISSFNYWLTYFCNKKTLDGTFVEWPLPVLDIDNVSTGTYNFKGRIPDIKLGPANGADGVMSKPSPESSQYDRVLLSGLWFPWASSEQIVL